ncbi:hypothetical protein [Pseudomonas sp. DTU_2021_1001937_2_SI_NGA_ILE_001]|uniref:hypothetical protein n=1 Tax=Pseudomonas sp. DTU_2021_1001937_2_SI_NGA_ILE_001 TaxID=3077589 RepID=UPI0028FC0CD9|nr:hypothetical protein [Pseudomonas sp. DTU_2021_1001937_2_SI_NGA_ILE_001]
MPLPTTHPEKRSSPIRKNDRVLLESDKRTTLNSLANRLKAKKNLAFSCIF